MDEKVYAQEIVPQAPFPGDPLLMPFTTPANPAGVFSSTAVSDKTFPRKRTAVELLSTALNTRSRKILKQFELQQSGGFQIGNFEEGLSGDTRITPDGIVMRNKAGIVTLAQDGDTGDAFLAGQLRAGSVVTGSIDIEDGGELIARNGNDSSILDAYGIVSSSLSSSANSANASLNQSFTDGTEADITGSQLPDLVLNRGKWVLFLGKATCYASTLDAANNGNLTIKLLSNSVEKDRMTFGGNRVTYDHNLRTMHAHALLFLAAGTYTFKMSGIMESITGSPVMLLYGFRISYIVIGT